MARRRSGRETGHRVALASPRVPVALGDKSRKRKKPAPKISATTVALIKQMAAKDCTWGAERIQGELLKLGIEVAKLTVQRYMKGVRPTGGGQTWATIFENHNVWACDFLQLHDCWFRPILAFTIAFGDSALTRGPSTSVDSSTAWTSPLRFFVVDVNSKEVLHVAVTRSPSETWTAQQLREITPFGEDADVIVRDRDGKFGGEFDRVTKGAEMRVVKTPMRTPNMNRSGKVQLAAAFHGGPRPSEARGDEVAVNAVCERFLGSVRRECLDHVLILNERHLENVLKEYVFPYFNTARPHQGIEQRIPVPSERKSFSPGAQVVALPMLGGLHHDYRIAA